MVEKAYSIIVSYFKRLHDPVTGASGPAITWRKAGAGIHAGNAPFVLTSVASYVDRFIENYRLANEATC